MNENLLPYQHRILTSEVPFLWIHCGYGSGKTRSLAQFITHEMLLFPGAFGCVYLNTGSQLDSSAWEEIQKYWTEKGITWYGPNQNSVVRLPNGSRLKLQTMAVRNAQLLAGPEWSFMAIDEAHLMKKEYWDVIKSRARRKTGSRKVRVYGLSVSPGEFLVEEFITTTDPDYGHVEATTYENRKNLPAGQIEKYEAMYPEGALRDRYLLGKIVPVEGTIYHQIVSHPNEYLIDPTDIPKLDAWVYGQDLGTVDPHVLLEGGVVGGVLYITKEYYQAGLDILQHLPALQQMYKEGWPVFSDHSAHIQKIMKRHGFNWINAWKEVDPGIQLVRNRVALKGIKISKDCVHLIKDIRHYKMKVLPSGKEVPEHNNSHGPDALRYMIVGLDKPNLFDALSIQSR